MHTVHILEVEEKIPTSYMVQHCLRNEPYKITKQLFKPSDDVDVLADIYFLVGRYAVRAIELIERLRSDEQIKYVPIVCYVVDDRDAATVKTLLMPCDSVLSMPMTPKNLMAAIQKAVDCEKTEPEI